MGAGELPPSNGVLNPLRPSHAPTWITFRTGHVNERAEHPLRVFVEFGDGNRREAVIEPQAGRILAYLPGGYGPLRTTAVWRVDLVEMTRNHTILSQPITEWYASPTRPTPPTARAEFRWQGSTITLHRRPPGDLEYILRPPLPPDKFILAEMLGTTIQDQPTPDPQPIARNLGITNTRYRTGFPIYDPAAAAFVDTRLVYFRRRPIERTVTFRRVKVMRIFDQPWLIPDPTEVFEGPNGEEISLELARDYPSRPPRQFRRELPVLIRFRHDNMDPRARSTIGAKIPENVSLPYQTQLGLRPDLNPLDRPYEVSAPAEARSEPKPVGPITLQISGFVLERQAETRVTLLVQDPIQR